MTTTGSDTARSHWTGTADTAEVERWTAVAEEVARTLGADALARDRANATPFAEVDVLRESGLVTLLEPAEYGGGGAHWSTALTAVRIIAREDASLAQLLGYHYVNSANIALVAPPAERERWHRATVDGRWLWGDSVNPVDPSLSLTPTDDGGYVLRGTKRFSTGSAVGQALLVNAVVDSGEHEGAFAFLVLPFGHPGVEVVDDWDHLGQRLSASNTVRYHDVEVLPEHLLGFGSDDPYESLVTPAIQLMFGNLYLGIAQGVLAHGRDITVARKNAWFLSTADRYAEDPFVQRVYGELVAFTAAVEALADRANLSLDRTLARGHDVTADDRAALEIEVARLKVVSSDVAVDAANRVFETTGSSSTASSVGLDLYWRNVRTHSLHDPVDYKKLEVGANYLTGAVQPVSLYT